jgi:hypothetical protein
MTEALQAVVLPTAGSARAAVGRTSAPPIKIGWADHVERPMRPRLQGRGYPAVPAAAGALSTTASPPGERRRMVKGAVRLCTTEDSKIVATTIAQSSS